MYVEVVAQTFVDEEALQRMGYVPHEIPSNDADDLAEAAGRLCYKSFHRPNPNTRQNWDYIGNIINQKHFSVLEHSSVSFYVSGVSRSLLLELERHRHLSFSVVSQRYVSHGNTGVVVPPIFEHLSEVDSFYLRDELSRLVQRSQDVYEAIDALLSANQFPKKQGKEAARAALIQATETEFIVTGNLRTWREVIEKRCSKHADREIHALASVFLERLAEIAPATFQDIGEYE